MLLCPLRLSCDMDGLLAFASVCFLMILRYDILFPALDTTRTSTQSRIMITSSHKKQHGHVYTFHEIIQ